VKYGAMIALALLSLLTACVKDDSERRIIEAAKRDSAAYCSHSKEGCEFSLVRRPDGWGVMAFPVTRAENGERVYVPGMFRSYSYDNRGKLLGEVPGV
jgi:hypothetical protein